MSRSDQRDEVSASLPTATSNTPVPVAATDRQRTWYGIGSTAIAHATKQGAGITTGFRHM